VDIFNIRHSMGQRSDIFALHHDQQNQRCHDCHYLNRNTGKVVTETFIGDSPYRK